MGKMDAVIDPLKRSLDDMPVHVKQLAHMFRKHGTQHKRNKGDVTELDAQRVPQDLLDAWKGDGKLPIHVVQTRKGDRPDPSTYLDEDYITRHRDRFADGGMRFYRRDSLETYGPGNRGTTFVFPRSEFQRIRDEVGNDPRALGRALGLGEHFFQTPDGKPVDIVVGEFSYGDLMNGNLRIPDGNEGGANPEWIPGGYLQNGMPEAVFDVPGDARGDNPSAWPGNYPAFSLDDD